MSKGTIVLVPFPFTDLSGHKVRPCLVLHEQKNGEDCLVACISSTTPVSSVYDLRVKPSPINGLKQESVIRCNKLATLQKKIFLGELGKLETSSLKAVDARLMKMLDL